MNIIKNVDKTLKKSLKIVPIRLISIVILLYMVQFEGISTFLNNPLFKIGISLIILYISTWDIVSAIVMLVAYILMLHTSSKKHIDTFVTDFIISQKNINTMNSQLSNMTDWVKNTQDSLSKKIFHMPSIPATPVTDATLSSGQRVKQEDSTPGIKNEFPICSISSKEGIICMNKNRKLYKGNHEILDCSNKNWTESNEAVCVSKGVIYNKDLKIYDVKTKKFI